MTRVELKERIDLTEKEQHSEYSTCSSMPSAKITATHDFASQVAGYAIRYFYLFHFSNLLGKDSEDIDIAIDNMTGSEFLEKSQNYFSRKVNIHIIKRNPEKSKQMRLYDQWIDFAQLRKEEPDENSRIPTKVECLFYNIHTGLVEDLTGRGIDDLKSGRLTTPLPAKTIFLEDPLASSLSFLYVLTQLESVVQIDMMISGNGPVSAVTYLSDFKLFEVVFAIPSSSEPAPTDNCGRYISFSLFYIQGEQRRLALYAAMFLPFRKTVYKDKKGKLVINIHNAAERFLPLILPLQLKDPFQLVNVDWATDVLEHWESISLNDPEVPATSKIRVVTGFLLRDIKDFWRVALLTSLLLYNDDDGMNLDFHLDKKREIYLTIQDNIREMRVFESVLNEKPLMKGDKIIKEVQNGGQVVAIQDSGPIIRDWQNKSLTWKLTYPKGSAEECISWMTNKDC
ncbi:hypothetical protein F2Q69_00026291 [Brassica cretica]|uniref:Poly A polymerase head domain-containing protein n=1 Tax=Brassica cretica TaxID=69181 RepID=A0A8S9S1R2_BRACR|nr:hypothetical protein F2Q69_00026291 [Brassica cretica]